MSLTESLSKFDKLFRPFLSKMPPKFYIDFYSRGRREFLNRLVDDLPKNINSDSWHKPVTVWGIKFNNNLFNSAGMFKSGKGYEMSAIEGAGAWLAGTTTAHPRTGNIKLGITHPLLPLPRSKSAINWLGLPNDGHLAMAAKIDKIDKIDKIIGCPIGVSVGSDPSDIGLVALRNLVDGMNSFQKTKVDFIELNESCPNVSSHAGNNNSLDNTMLERLEYISDNFLKKRYKKLPVVVKYSVDTDKNLLGDLIPLLYNLGFDGINLGNTSTNYKSYHDLLSESEKSTFEYFITNFGGGVSGKFLKNKSLELASEAVKIIKTINVNREFVVIRTGGIDSSADIKESNASGIALNQWYTGYFENFSSFGHKLYKEIFTSS